MDALRLRMQLVDFPGVSEEDMLQSQQTLDLQQVSDVLMKFSLEPHIQACRLPDGTSKTTNKRSRFIVVKTSQN